MYDAEGLRSVGDLVEDIHPGTHVYYIRLDDEGSEDRKATFFGNVTAQVEQVCEAVHNNTNLHDHHTGRVRVDALGFSQGGQFLRALIQTCAGLDVRSLVTFGSQHNGIAEFKGCGTFDLLCKGAVALMKSNAWTEYVQSHVVPGQYYRTVNESTGAPSDDFLEHSGFLADINNERALKNATYAERLSALERFVMYVFEDDTTVIPKESGWFAEVNATSRDVTRLQDRKIYEEDWLGLKRLDQKGALVFKSTPGNHMELDDEVLTRTIEEYFGPENGAKSRADEGILHRGKTDL
jgi:palmitoyl-protein thioesterase